MEDDDRPVGRILSRREALRVLGAMGLLPLAGSEVRALDGPGRPAMPRQEMCVVRPSQTVGPYYLDVLLDRSDIRTDPPGQEVTAGVPLDLTINVSRIAGNRCTPYEGAVVDIWQCDAAGVYSGVRDPRFDTVGQRWLRGYQIADARGQARFTTIYPGWYRGRTVHLHFKVRTSVEQGAREFVSQLYFDDAVTDRVFARAPYVDHPGNRTRNEGDSIFRNGGGERLMLELAEAGDGYRATFDLGVQL